MEIYSRKNKKIKIKKKKKKKKKTYIYIKLEYVRTTYRLADPLTKPVNLY